jgi:hypothetical protein
MSEMRAVKDLAIGDVIQVDGFDGNLTVRSAKRIKKGLDRIAWKTASATCAGGMPVCICWRSVSHPAASTGPIGAVQYAGARLPHFRIHRYEATDLHHRVENHAGPRLSFACKIRASAASKASLLSRMNGTSSFSPWANRSHLAR